MAESLVLVERLDPVGVVTLNRPALLNALSNELLGEVAGALEALDADHAIRAIIVTGGPRVFGAGVDLKQLAAELDASPGAVDFLHARFALWDRIRRTRNPLVAAVAGYALGAGCELALACDLIVAAESARFASPEVGLGLIPGAGATQRLARSIGKARAMELVLTGRFLTAYEAESFGLVNRVVPNELLLQEALSLARDIATKAPLAARLGKDAVLDAFEVPLEEGLAFERQGIAGLLQTEDVREGIQAFLERRPPVFHGR